MKYKIEGSGPQFPQGYSSTADTAAEALNRRQAVQKLCGQAAVFDEAGEVDLGTLQARAQRERQDNRKT